MIVWKYFDKLQKKRLDADFIYVIMLNIQRTIAMLCYLMSYFVKSNLKEAYYLVLFLLWVFLKLSTDIHSYLKKLTLGK